MKFQNLLHITILVQTFSCNAQTKDIALGTYAVDPSITTAATNSIKMDGTMPLGQMDIKMFENDKEIHNTFNTTKKIPFLTRTNIYGDVISLTGFAGMFAGFGFMLNIRGDSCEIFFLVKTDDPYIYKLNITDSVYKTGLLVPCTSGKIILSKKPDGKTLTQTNPLEGYIELESQEYYQKADGHDDKFKVLIKTYFKTAEVE